MMMMSRLARKLANPDLVAGFQKFCGVELIDDSDSTETARVQQAGVCNWDSTRPKRDAWHRHGHTQPSKGDHSKNGNNNYINSDSTRVANNICQNGFIKHFNDYHCGAVSNGVAGSTNHPAQTRDRSDSIDRTTTTVPDNRSTASDTGLGSSKLDNELIASNGSSVVLGINNKTNCWDRAKHGNSNGHADKSIRVSIRYPFLYYCAKIGAFLGNEEFYLSGLPFLMWTVDSVIIRQLSIVWGLVMYLGQASKDYLGWPRPPSPPVVRLETEHLAEFSMPSTHAMAGTAIPLLLVRLLLERYQLPVVPVLCIAGLWCITVCWSRVYLGVHTVLDVVCGFFLALVVFIVLTPLMSSYDYYQQTHLTAPLVLLPASLALCTVCYPSAYKSSSKEDAVTIVAVVVGVGMGAWLNFQLGFSVNGPRPVKLPMTLPTLWWFEMSLLQLVVGVTVVFMVKAAVKWVLVKFSCVILGLDKQDTEHPSVMVGYKYPTYLSLGLVITFFAPLLFTLLGFGRPGYYHEVV